ncbi:MAG: phosphotyrosine protein phosphatase [Spirulinaceae cyanobacterium RM2_2_10]|nr:phosphotyrosine protein phosphatase [Spirulinaceae cyanobacterium SM2_1_0]NJO20309.1 phosphotyrosine protein phosphatase [Spirulinaceae cyanobacterium RM2_2_10]
MNLLCVCSENRRRSATAEVVYSEYAGIEAIGAGTNKDAVNPISGDLIEWADLILAMETQHREKISQKFRSQLKGKRLAVLAIPDRYEYMQPELVRLLQAKLPKYINL